MRGPEDERESGYDSIDPLRDETVTELSASPLIMRHGENRCNMGYENVRRSCSGDGGREKSETSTKPSRAGVLHFPFLFF